MNSQLGFRFQKSVQYLLLPRLEELSLGPGRESGSTGKGITLLFPASCTPSVTSALHALSRRDRRRRHPGSHWGHTLPSAAALLLFCPQRKRHPSLENHQLHQQCRLPPGRVLEFFRPVSTSLNFIRIVLSVSFKASARPCKKAMLTRLFVRNFCCQHFPLGVKLQ